MIWDAAVIGAGPAGSVAALVLARTGMRVLLLDRPVSRGELGEALPAAAGRLMRTLGLPVPNERQGHAPVGGTLSCWGSAALSGTDAFVDPDGPGWRLNRVRFDAELRQAAYAAGAVARLGRLRSVQRHGLGWRMVLDDGGEAACAWLVDATGRSRAAVRRLGVERQHDAPLAAVSAVAPPGAKITLNRTLVEAHPNGWWYAARLSDGGVVASFQTAPRTAAAMVGSQSAWCRALSETLHASVALVGAAFEHAHGRDAAGSRLLVSVGEGWVACGDAAHAFDPLSSQGILSAMHGGMTAAQGVIEALRGAPDPFVAHLSRLESIGRAYQQRIAAAYREELRWRDESFWALRQVIHRSVYGT